MTGRDGQPEPILVRVASELAPLLPRFLENRRKDLARCRSALEEGNLETLQNVGHAIKGTAGGYGFEGMSDIGGALEKSAAQGEALEVRRHVEELGDYLERVQVEID